MYVGNVTGAQILYKKSCPHTSTVHQFNTTINTFKIYKPTSTRVTMQLTNILAFFALTAVAVAAPQAKKPVPNPKPVAPPKPAPPVINNQVVRSLLFFQNSPICNTSLLAIP
jgi:hypothetical protein